jgi:antibiotic biosynthesis monooxygenase (ABM) superfamily enzyme
MSSPKGPAVPSVHLRAFLTWLAVYPTITIALIVLQPWISEWPVAAQTLVLTVIVVPVAAYWLIPLLMKTAVRGLNGQRRPRTSPSPGRD